MEKTEEPKGVAEHVESVIRHLKSTIRFVDRMPDVKKLVGDILRWSTGEDLDAKEVKENYPGWKREDFDKVVRESNLAAYIDTSNEDED